MSQIDKLVNKAFPDELRHVEPIDVDGDALIARTMEKLGLPQPTARPAAPQGKAPKGERLVAVPLVAVRHLWVNRAGWALAACLVLACGIYWGPRLLRDLGFGSRAPASQGDAAPHGYVQDTGSSAAPGNGLSVAVDVTEVKTAGRGFSVSLYFYDQATHQAIDTREVSLYDITLANRDGGVFQYDSRANRNGTVTLTFDNWDKNTQPAPFTLTVNRLTAGETGGVLAWEAQCSFQVDPEN